VAVWLRLALVVGSIAAVLTVTRSVQTRAQGTPEGSPAATPNLCLPQPAVDAMPLAEDGSFPMPACGTI
jgi:hypothetical protein